MQTFWAFFLVFSILIRTFAAVYKEPCKRVFIDKVGHRNHFAVPLQMSDFSNIVP